jgi:hypothetical protein
MIYGLIDDDYGLGLYKIRYHIVLVMEGVGCEYPTYFRIERPYRQQSQQNVKRKPLYCVHNAQPDLKQLHTFI